MINLYRSYSDSSKFLLGLAAVTALLNPLKSLKLLRLGVRGLVAAATSFGTGLSRASGGLGGNVDAQGRQLTKNKAGKFVVAPGQKGAGQFSKSIPKSTFLKGLGNVHSISHMVGAEYNTHHIPTVKLQDTCSY